MSSPARLSPAPPLDSLKARPRQKVPPPLLPTFEPREDRSSNSQLARAPEPEPEPEHIQLGGGQTPPRSRRAPPPLDTIELSQLLNGTRSMARMEQSAGQSEGGQGEGTTNRPRLATLSRRGVGKSADFSDLSKDVARSMQRQKMQAATGVGLRADHAQKFRALGTQSQNRNSKADNFWTMQDLVRLSSPEEIIDLLQMERSKDSQSGGSEWTSTRSPMSGERAGDTSWSSIFGDSAAGVNLADDLMGWTIGHHAAAQGKLHTLRALLEWNPRLGYQKEWTVDCQTSYKLDLCIRTKKTRTIAYVAKTAELKEQEELRLAYGSQPDSFGSTMLHIALNRVKHHKADKTADGKQLHDSCLLICDLLEAKETEGDEALREVDLLSSARHPKTGLNLFYDEAEMRLSKVVNESNIFSRAVAKMLLLWSLDRMPGREMAELPGRESLPKMQAAVSAWLMTDPSMLGLPSDEISHIFLSLLTQIKLRAEEADGDDLKDQLNTQYMPMVEAIFRTIGPDGLYILDFTLQNADGQTAKHLVDAHTDVVFRVIPDAIYATTPVFGDLKPTAWERFTYHTTPFWYLLDLTLYIDIGKDLWLLAEFYCLDKEQGTFFFVVDCVLLIFHALVQITFDWKLTLSDTVQMEVSEKKKRQKWFAVSTVMQLSYTRYLYETYFALTEYQKGREKEELMPRSAPASHGHYALVQGLFQALPQVILQTLVIMFDLLTGRASGKAIVGQVSGVALSMATSSMAFADMGMRIHDSWRMSFGFVVATQLIMRAVATAYLIVSLLLTNYLDPQTDDMAKNRFIFLVYWAFSFWTTVFFDVVVHRKGFSVHSCLSLVFSFTVPINLPRFTILTMAQPRPSSLPFYIIRQLEIAAVFVLFALHTPTEQSIGNFGRANSEVWAIPQETRLEHAAAGAYVPPPLNWTTHCTCEPCPGDTCGDCTCLDPNYDDTHYSYNDVAGMVFDVYANKGLGGEDASMSGSDLLNMTAGIARATAWPGFKCDLLNSEDFQFDTTAARKNALDQMDEALDPWGGDDMVFDQAVLKTHFEVEHSLPFLCKEISKDQFVSRFPAFVMTVQEWLDKRNEWGWKLDYPLAASTQASTAQDSACKANCTILQDDKDGPAPIMAADCECDVASSFNKGNADNDVLDCLRENGRVCLRAAREKAFWSTRVFSWTVVEAQGEEDACDTTLQHQRVILLLGLFLVAQIAYLSNAIMPYDYAEDYAPSVKRLRGETKERALELLGRSGA